MKYGDWYKNSNWLNYFRGLEQFCQSYFDFIKDYPHPLHILSTCSDTWRKYENYVWKEFRVNLSPGEGNEELKRQEEDERREATNDVSQASKLEGILRHGCEDAFDERDAPSFPATCTTVPNRCMNMHKGLPQVMRWKLGKGSRILERCFWTVLQKRIEICYTVFKLGKEKISWVIVGEMKKVAVVRFQLHRLLRLRCLRKKIVIYHCKGLGKNAMQRNNQYFGWKLKRNEASSTSAMF